MIKTQGTKQVCFKKDLKPKDSIRLSFAVSSESKKTIDVTLLHVPTKTVTYSAYDKDMGSMEINFIENFKPGTYELCFKPRDGAKRFITFTFSTLYEGLVSGLQLNQQENNFTEASKDDDFKGTLSEVIEIKKIFEEMEGNNRQLLDRRNRHLEMFHSIYGSIRMMNLIKFFIIVGMTVFQIVIIRNYFGEDKRVTKLKGINKDDL